MMKKLLLAMFLMLAIVVSGCSSAGSGLDLLIEGTREFDLEAGEHGYLAVRYIEHMQEVLPYRLAFTERELETAEWIVAILEAMGFNEDQIERQTFRYDTITSSWFGDIIRRISLFEERGYYEGSERIDYSQNIILTIPGRSEQTILIGAHYDGVRNPGISDNAAGVALLLESAYRMRDQDHYYTLQYVFLGAEEIALNGVFYFADQLSEAEIDNLILMINADVILDGPYLVYAMGYVEQLPLFPMDMLRAGTFPDVLQSTLTMQIDDIANVLNTNNDTELIAKPEAIFLPSDHLAFLQFTIPVIYFYGTNPVEYPETFAGDVLHTPNDDLDFIMDNFPGRIERAVNVFGYFLEQILMSEF